MKIISWNVNGIRAGYKKGLLEFLEREKPDIFCVQETKAHREQIPPPQTTPLDMESHWSSATRKGYSGTATFLKEPCEEVSFGIDIEKFDSEGRFTITDHEDFVLFNIYFPNGSSRKERHDYKQEFLKELNSYVDDLIGEGREIIVLGDYNVAPLEIDVHDPIGLANTSGFLPEEREWYQSFIDLGFVDTFRHFHPDATDRFTWWDQRTRARLANRGWRIDHICVTEGLMERVTHMDHMEEQEGSDHCPIYIELEDA